MPSSLNYFKNINHFYAITPRFRASFPDEEKRNSPG